MADRDTIVFLGTIADSREDFLHLADVLIPILKHRQEQRRESATALSWSVTPQRSISMRDAYFAKTEMVDAAAALGRVSADLIAPYPPGVAVVAPGEVLTQQIIEGLASSRAAGVRIAYATDPTLSQYRVVLES
jgi:lysine decarboxylase